MQQQDMCNRFWSQVHTIPFHECWEWGGACNPYGKFRMGDGRRVGAHVASYILHNGDFTSDRRTAVVRHTCHNESCVRPDHLILGTQKENVQDTVQADRRYSPTHCPQGHEYTPENTRYNKGYGQGKVCRRCDNIKHHPHLTP